MKCAFGGQISEVQLFLSPNGLTKSRRVLIGTKYLFIQKYIRKKQYIVHRPKYTTGNDVNSGKNGQAPEVRYNGRFR